MKDTKIQWHPGFVAAMNLELAASREGLIFEKEYNLNTKPLEIDLLIIKKESGVKIENEIGKIFRGHNILEYKSPEDHLDIDAFYKAGAYASLYKSYGKVSDGIKAEDITVSLVRDARPDKLFRYFEKKEYQVSNPAKGIYYIKGKVLFPTQIIVTRELPKGTHTWLRALSGELDQEDVRELVNRVRSLNGKQDRELADSVFNISVEANRQMIREMRRDADMYEALMEILEPGIQIRVDEGVRKGMQQGMQQGLQKGMQQGLQQGIEGTVELLRDFGVEDEKIKQAIMKKYKISGKEAEKYL